MTLPSTPLLATLGGVVALLVAASAVAAWRTPPGGEVRRRIRSWWAIVALFGGALLAVLGSGSRWPLTLLFAFVSYLALKEYLTIVPTRMADRRVLGWIYLAIPLQYLFVQVENYGMFVLLVPVYLLLWLPMAMVLGGETKGFLSAVGTLQWGAMVTVYGIGHLAYLPALPGDLDGGLDMGMRLLLFVLLLTALNDVAQYLWGTALGRRKVAPTVSPGKTLEGVLGGAVTTTLLALALAPLLTPMAWWLALAVGLLLSVAGFLGDLAMSAIKRDLHLKDSGDAIPGHGGVLDRIDSLTYTAPLFFHVIRFVFYLPEFA